MKQAWINIKATEGLLIALAYVFILTMAVFPGLSMDSHFAFLKFDDPEEEESWYNSISVTIFGGFGLAGRYIGGLSCVDVKRRTALLMSALRTIFLATFLAVAFECSPAWLFQSDWFKILNDSLCAFTNGYCGTLCAVKAPQTVKGD